SATAAGGSGSTASPPARRRFRLTFTSASTIRSATRRSTPTRPGPPGRRPRRAGLHCTPPPLDLLDVERVTLHVGLDTFRPVSEPRLEAHAIHSERYGVEPSAWKRIREANRVLAVGTTTVRVLETL